MTSFSSFKKKGMTHTIDEGSAKEKYNWKYSSSDMLCHNLIGLLEENKVLSFQ